MARQYSDLLTWSHPYGEYSFCHQDGAVSVAIGWDGLDADMLTSAEMAQAWTRIYTLVGLLGEGYCSEFHLFREADQSLADEYLARGDDMVRGQDLGRAVRKEIASHLARYGMSNKALLVLTRLPVPSLLLLGGAKRALLNQAKRAEELERAARMLAKKLPGGRMKSYEEYAQDIDQALNRDAYQRGWRYRVDPRFLIAEQMVRAAPQLERDDDDDEKRARSRVRVGDTLTKVLLVAMYPNADPGWFVSLSMRAIAMHVTQIVIPVNTRNSLRKSERESDLAEGTLGRRGRTEHAKALTDLGGFQRFVSENGLGIFKNAYIIRLHGTDEELTDHERAITDLIESMGGQVRSEAWMQLPYFRAALPGQGYRCPKFRTDHTWQVGNMMPCQVFRRGERNPESLRLASSGGLVGFNTTTEVIPHSVTVAMTGGGKGVEKVAQIAETYPFGVDWYIAEIGGSYRWIVEGFGGVYSKVDPSHTVINPLPPYSVANLDVDLPSDFTLADHEAVLPLDAKLAGGTVNALAFLLTDGRPELTIHEAAAAQHALQRLYAKAPADAAAPTLLNFLEALESGSKDLSSEPQKLASKSMTQNLDSFLETTEGRIFTRQNNLVLSEGITGVDLKDVDRASPKLLKFYLVFLALRFNHLAFARRTPARVLLDEMKKFVEFAPAVMGRLISELARMGRKDAAAIDLVTQGIQEIDVIEKEILNSMPLRMLLYRPDGCDEIASRLQMPPGVLDRWKRYPNPTGFDWRPGIRSVGNNYFDLQLTFPQIILDLGATGPAELDLKESIGAMTQDPFKRLELFREAKLKEKR